jgi:hypothetical protein
MARIYQTQSNKKICFRLPTLIMVKSTRKQLTDIGRWSIFDPFSFDQNGLRGRIVKKQIRNISMIFQGIINPMRMGLEKWSKHITSIIQSCTSNLFSWMKISVWSQLIWIVERKSFPNFRVGSDFLPSDSHRILIYLAKEMTAQLVSGERKRQCPSNSSSDTSDTVSWITKIWPLNFLTYRLGRFRRRRKILNALEPIKNRLKDLIRLSIRSEFYDNLFIQQSLTVWTHSLFDDSIMFQTC